MPSEREASSITTLLVEHWAEITTTCLLAVLGYLVSTFVADFKQHAIAESRELHELETRVRVGEIELSRVAARQAIVLDRLTALSDANAKQWEELRRLGRK